MTASDPFPDELRHNPRPAGARIPTGATFEEWFHDVYWPRVLEHRRAREDWFNARGLFTREQRDAVEFPR